MTYQLLSPKLEQIALRVVDLEKMIQFYRHLPGFYLLSEENNLGFFSTHKHQPAFLIIEDTPFGSLDSGPVKKLSQVSISVKDDAQFAKIISYLTELGLSFTYDESAQRLTFADVEGNQLEFVAATDANQHDLYELAHLNVNVNNEKSAADFFAKLGLTTEKALLEFQEKAVSWQAPNENKLDYTGLDFVKLNVDAETLANFAEHLRTINADFYADPRVSIVTMFDPNGVEWWITTAKQRKQEQDA